ncbi:hypothetical protein [Bacteroides cellulosilyticus]|mgnify:FL=1|jgi:hypothetical protein|uniref:hypothetical protein n=1 Tax=Bacteroides cellulosilyticus TaxID=246787 RepID=UPI001D065B62|nr:hypothetical protein [Bacteroides cellulosilyticus]MCB6590855.1 hypothetical protein [Bacteroides cellulosilyticus]MEB3372607.1 hypothetical protein [Bacteroides sp. CR5/BHMF/2]UWH91810.1 MAG: hypothetical protein [Bacteriophage sp.]
MKIYSPLNKVVRVTIEDQNTGTIIENTVKFSIAESNCEEVCKLIEKSFKNNLLPVITGAREIGKSRSVKIDISELDNSGAKMRKISRTINMQGVNATEVGTRMIELVNEAERLAIIKRAKELTV